jgi:voltage-gated potassium channel
MTAPRSVRLLSSYFEGPKTVRNAIRVIVAATLVTTLVSGVVVWIFDRPDFRTFGDAMWWALQTVTTVGYGDVTPKRAVGRIVGAIILLYAVALISVLTATITANFIERTKRERHDGGEPDISTVLERLDALAARLDGARVDERERA